MPKKKGLNESICVINIIKDAQINKISKWTIRDIYILTHKLTFDTFYIYEYRS